MVKPCNRCKKNPRHRGSYCKSCWTAIHRDWRKNNGARRREINRLSKQRTRERDGPEETRRKWNEWYARNKEHRKAYQNERRDPEKEKARYAVRREIKAGKLFKPTHCSECNIRKSVDAHHKDYSQPLEITWLCRECHSRVHNLKTYIMGVSSPLRRDSPSPGRVAGPLP